MIWIYIFARSATSTLKQSSTVTVKGVTKTTSDGMISFDLVSPGTYNVTVSSAGYQTFQGDLTFGHYSNIADVTLDPELPVPPGDTGVCFAETYNTDYGRRWTYTHPDLGRIGGDYDSRDRAEGAARGDNRCKIRYPPPLTEEERITRNVVQRVQGQIETAITNALAPFADLEARIKAWITNSIFELLMKNLNAAAIEYKKQRGK